MAAFATADLILWCACLTILAWTHKHFRLFFYLWDFDFKKLFHHFGLCIFVRQWMWYVICSGCIFVNTPLYLFSGHPRESKINSRNVFSTFSGGDRPPVEYLHNLHRQQIFSQRKLAREHLIAGAGQALLSPPTFDPRLQSWTAGVRSLGDNSSNPLYCIPFTCFVSPN